MNNRDKLNEIEEFLIELERVEWFAKVGESYNRPGIRCVDSWQNAFAWSCQPITEWCSFEAKSRIYRLISKNHYNIFVQWNDVAKSLLPACLRLVDAVKHQFPDDAPQQAIDRLQSQIVGAALELYYSHYTDSNLHRDQIDMYRDGHFPCGWHVETETDFPDRAVVVVF